MSEKIASRFLIVLLVLLGGYACWRSVIELRRQHREGTARAAETEARP